MPRHTESHVLSIIDQAEQLKEQGNEFFQQKKYAKALKKYKYMSLYLNGLDTDFQSTFLSNSNSVPHLNNENTLEKIKEKYGEDSIKYKISSLTNSLLNNQSICYLKLGNPQKAIRCTNKALEIDPNNLKTKLRRFQASIEIGDYDVAKADFLDLKRELKDDKIILQSEKQLAALEKKNQSKEKQMYSKMFSGI